MDACMDACMDKMQNYHYIIGKTGTLDSVCKELYAPYGYYFKQYILLGLRDRNDEEFVKNLRYTLSFRDLCTIGHMSLINAASTSVQCYKEGLYGACEGGHLDLVNLMIEKGANDWNWGLNCTCLGGNIDIVNAKVMACLVLICGMIVLIMHVV